MYMYLFNVACSRFDLVCAASEDIVGGSSWDVCT